MANNTNNKDDLLEWIAIFHECLSGLISLKDYKDKNGKDEYYEESQPKQWHMAKQALELWAKLNIKKV